MTKELQIGRHADGDLIQHAGAIIADWLEFERLNGASPATVRTYHQSIAVFLKWAEGQDLASRPATASDIRVFKDFLSKDYSPATVNLRLSAVRAFYRWMVATDKLPFNPAKAIKGVKRANSRRHKRDALTASEVVRILEAAEDGTEIGARNRAMLALFAYCALRTVEVHRANIGHLQTKGDRMVLNVWGKGHLEADDVVIIPASQEGIIRDWIRLRLKIRPAGPEDPLFISLSTRNRGSRLTERSIRGIVKDLYAEAGVVGSRKTTHSLRHTAISRAINNGAELTKVQSMARHRTLDTTMIYYHEADRLNDPAEDHIEY